MWIWAHVFNFGPLEPLVMLQVHVVVEEQGPRGDDAHQGVGGGQRRRNGRPLFPGEQSPQRAFHLPRAVGGESSESCAPSSHRRQLRPLRGAASHLRRTRDSLGVRLALRRTERGTDVAAVLNSSCHHNHHRHSAKPRRQLPTHGRNHDWKVEGDQDLGLNTGGGAPRSLVLVLGCWVREGVAPFRCEGPGVIPQPPENFLKLRC